ncbi:MAG TPA: dipicolinate synthase subunit DpsA, partial [Clostridia bacterium]|nr:dipicolinate synthase subunit DpsA [Clostridia bacterium]
MDKMRFAVVGGDLRSIMLAKMLRADGNYVKTFGLELAEDKEISDEFNMEEAVSDADIVVGPIPCTEDGIHVRTPFHKG